MVDNEIELPRVPSDSDSSEKPKRKKARDKEGIVELTEEDEYDVQLNRVKWKNRRRMAWVSLVFFFGITSYMLFNMELDRLKAVDEIYTWLAIFCLTVIGAYMGATTYADISMTKTGSSSRKRDL